MIRVRLWTSFPAPDGQAYQPGEEADVSPDLADAICTAGAGEIVSGEVELAVHRPRERAVAKRQRKGAS